MAGIPLYLAGVIQPGVIPHLVTATAGFLMVHYTAEDPYSAGPGPDPWHPRSDELYDPQTPAPTFQMDFEHDVTCSYVSLRTSTATGELYITFYTHDDQLRIFTAENLGFLSPLGTIDVPYAPPVAGNMHLVFEGGAITLTDDDDNVLAEASAVDINALFVTATVPTPYSFLNLYPYAFSCTKDPSPAVDDSGVAGMVNVYYDGTGSAPPDFWTNFILAYEEP